MTNDSFSHDEGGFEHALELQGLDLHPSETRYAELFSEALQAGAIGADKRAELAETASTFGLPPDRVARIERAVAAAHESRGQGRAAEATAVRAETLAPFAAADDRRLAVLQARITVLEEEVAKLRAENQALGEQNLKLDQELADLHEVMTRSNTAVGVTLDPLRVAAMSPDMTQPSAKDEPSPTSQPSPASRRAIRRGDPALIHQQLRQAPRDTDLLHALFRSLGRADDLDRRYCIASAVVYLGAANDEERDLYATHAHAGLARPKRAVNEDEWSELLIHPLQDRLAGAIFADVAVAALLGQVSALRAGGRASALDPAYKVDPARTTSEAARSLSWAAAVLGLRVPPIYVAPSDAFTSEIVLGQTPSTRIGTKLFDRSPRELAFAAGRHLTWYRREHILAKLAPNRRQLEDVFLAALSLGNPGVPMAVEIKTRIEPIVRAMAPLLDKAAIERLAGHFTGFIEQGGRTNLVRWLDAVDHSAACAGLLLCGDLPAAHAMLELEDSDAPAGGEARGAIAPKAIAARMDELIVYTTAHRYSLLRKRIGLAVLPA